MCSDPDRWFCRGRFILTQSGKNGNDSRIVNSGTGDSQAVGRRAKTDRETVPKQRRNSPIYHVLAWSPLVGIGNQVDFITLTSRSVITANLARGWWLAVDAAAMRRVSSASSWLVGSGQVAGSGWRRSEEAQTDLLPAGTGNATTAQEAGNGRAAMGVVVSDDQRRLWPAPDCASANKAVAALLVSSLLHRYCGSLAGRPTSPCG